MVILCPMCLFKLRLPKKAARWNACILVVRLPRQTCLYQMRHGGASANFVEGRRSPAGFQLCGRWASASDVKRCIKTGQLPIEVAECTARYNVRKMMIVTAPTYLNFLQNHSTEDTGTILSLYALRNTKETKSVAPNDWSEQKTTTKMIDVTQAGSDWSFQREFVNSFSRRPFF